MARLPAPGRGASALRFPLKSLRLTSAGRFAVAAAASLGWFACGSSPAPDVPPNVVLIISDDHGWTDYGFMGHPVVRTAALDRLAAESMVYTRGYLPAPVCRPSLATIATGLYPHRHGITGNDPPGDWREAMRDPVGRADMEAVFARNQTVAELLGRAGYVSHQSGKWWEGNPLDHGFTAAMTHGDVTRQGRHGDDGLTIGRESMEPIFEFVEAAGEAPFFLWYAPFLPHRPHDPPERFLEEYRTAGLAEPVAQYYAMIGWLDETVGQLLDFLDQRGLAENTVVLYVADNGWLAAEEREQQNRTRAKMSPYDLGVRTPIMVRWPGRVAPGRDDATLVGSIDLAPTILGAAGLPPPPGMSGHDLRDSEALGRRDLLFGATFAHTARDTHDPIANLKYRSVVSAEGWKLILPYRPNRDVPLMLRAVVADWMQLEPELYQVLQDPHETRDLAGERPGKVEELRAALQQWWPVPE